ncbi:hypothetical protein [Streptomyces sp. Isolate_219]|uniref:hypothetical protein n=1 Tax=Streptomyces sp. Isolate_219 TaxID=2950110 RepID=UPI0021C69706|nr:hypothetical protein [Streptomyces sp. Isolate_219]MCR8574158.1 hypothetical protein [Streptomyces sp. Isolate_219]
MRYSPSTVTSLSPPCGAMLNRTFDGPASPAAGNTAVSAVGTASRTSDCTSTTVQPESGST